MNKQSIIIYDFEIMFNILNEIRENLEFEVFKFNKDDKITNLNINKYGNYLIVVNSSSNFLAWRSLGFRSNQPVKTVSASTFISSF